MLLRGSLLYMEEEGGRARWVMVWFEKTRQVQLNGRGADKG